MRKSNTYRTFSEELNKKLFQQKHASPRTVVLNGTSFGMEMLCIKFKVIILFKSIVSFKFRSSLFRNSVIIIKNKLSSFKTYKILFNRLAGLFRNTGSSLQVFVRIHLKKIPGIINSSEKEVKKLPAYHWRDHIVVRWSVTQLLVTDLYYSRRNYSALSTGDDSMISRDCLRF